MLPHYFILIRSARQVFHTLPGHLYGVSLSHSCCLLSGAGRRLLQRPRTGRGSSCYRLLDGARCRRCLLGGVGGCRCRGSATIGGRCLLSHAGRGGPNDQDTARGIGGCRCTRLGGWPSQYYNGAPARGTSRWCLLYSRPI